MKQDVIFIPLGGGQRVGASCYYLKIGNSNIILDAGIGIKNGLEYGPNFRFLLMSPFMESMGQIDQIFISHAHMDHVGHLLKLMSETPRANVYMTEITRIFTWHQLYNNMFIGKREGQEDARLAAMSLLDKITPVSFLKTIDFKNYKVTFYPAGHIPGAMMVLFEIGKRKILYTGDYSIDRTALTRESMVPDGLDIDTVIICGLHAKHSGYRKTSDDISSRAKQILRNVKRSGRSVMCQLSQLSKGVEFLKTMNEQNTEGVPIYLDESIMKMVANMEQLSIPILNRYNKVAEWAIPHEPHVFLTSNANHVWKNRYYRTRVDFSLHEDFSEMKAFLKKIDPRQAVFVHCEKEWSPFEHTIEQELMWDGESKTQIIFAEENEVYRL